MVAERVDETTESNPPAAAQAPEPLCRADLTALLQQAGDAQLAALREDKAALQQQLDEIRGTLRTAVVADVMALLSETAAPAESELQRRARAIQVELTLRRQDVALAEWHRVLAQVEEAAERRRQLFARLEADFGRKTAEYQRREAEFAQHDAVFAQRETEFAARAAMFDQRAAEFAQQAEGFQRALDDFVRRSADFDHRTVTLERRAADLQGEVTRLHEVEDSLWQRLAERDVGAAATEIAAASEIAKAASELSETRGQRIEALEHELAKAESRVGELQSSRWRRIGLALGLARRATFE
jgi:hypothetical protein